MEPQLQTELDYIFILGLTDPLIVVDHKNHNGLDNRRQNIWACTQKENMANKRKFKNIPNNKEI